MSDGSRLAPSAVGPLTADEYVDVLARTGMGLVCVLGRDGRVLAFDEACERATGFSADEVVGRDARETVIPPEEEAAFSLFLEQIADDPSPRPQVGHWQTAEGERRSIAWSNRPLFDERGAVTGLLTVGIDLTERARLSGELERRLAQLERLAAEQAALRRVATLVAGEAGAELILDVISSEVGRLLGARVAAIVRYVEGVGVVVARWNAEGHDWVPVGEVVELSEGYAVGRVARTGEAARIDEPREHAIALSSVAAPVGLSKKPWGAIVVAADETLPPWTEARLGAFADLLALAISSADAREQLIASRARLVEAADAERRRLERDLHDGAQQRLVTLALNLGIAQRKVSDAEVGVLLAAAERDTREAIADLRNLASGLHPPILAERGLPPALAALARRAPISVELAHVPEERFPPTLEVAVYYVVGEALTNVAKHAEAEHATVSVRVDGRALVVTVADDGRGGANPRAGSGLIGLTDRVEALRGTLDLTSSRGGTTLRATFPLPQ